MGVKILKDYLTVLVFGKALELQLPVAQVVPVVEVEIVPPVINDYKLFYLVTFFNKLAS